jgi:hypothetical protein
VVGGADRHLPDLDPLLRSNGYCAGTYYGGEAMPRFRTFGQRSAIAIGTGAVLVAVSATSFAAVDAIAASGSTVYYACLHKGVLSQVGTKPPSCPTTATAVSWNRTGPAGAPGADGKTILSGTKAKPSGGRAGDFYLDTQGDVLWGPKTASGWPDSGTPLRGAPGQDGSSAGISTTDAGSNCPDGGVEIDTTNGGVAGPPAYVCNGSKGDTGEQGQPGPGAVSVDSEHNDNPDVADISGVGVSIAAYCGDNSPGVATLVITSDGTFSVSGSYMATGVADVTPTSGNVSTLNGTVLRDDNDQTDFEIDASSSAELSAHLVVTSGGSVASLEVFMAGSTTTGCEVRAVGVPTG